MNISEIRAEKIISNTSIDLADAVVNPYRGCIYGCKYCYASKSKQAEKRKEDWGKFLDVKINAVELFEREISKCDVVQTILFGSQTEVYQNIEKKYCLMSKILDICVRNQKNVVILTRSPLITRDINILEKLNHKIFFTISPSDIKKKFEVNSPSVMKRISAIKQLKQFKLNVVPYICPLFPHHEYIERYFKLFSLININEIHFENLNINVIGGLKNIADVKSHFFDTFEKIYSNEKKYNMYWNRKKEEAQKLAEKYNMKVYFHLHSYKNYCHIKYKVSAS